MLVALAPTLGHAVFVPTGEARDLQNEASYKGNDDEPREKGGQPDTRCAEATKADKP